jgi:hypothetical protein
MNAPVVAVVHVAHSRSHTTLSHDRMRFAEQRFGDYGNSYSRGRGLNGSAQAGASSANDQHIMFVRDVLGH